MKSLCDSLSTQDIHRCLSGNPKLRGIFKGCFSADLLPRVQFHTDTVIIVHTERHDISFGHWEAIAILPSKRVMYFFDSFGRKPHVTFHINFIKKQKLPCFYNTMDIQHVNSNSCGQFVCLFAYYISKFQDMMPFLMQFSSDLHHNEKVVHCQFVKYFGVYSHLNKKLQSRVIRNCKRL
jgi:hypothetical protein